MRRRLAAVAVVIALAGCGSRTDSEPSEAPTFGTTDAPPAVDDPQLASAKAEAGIEDCPVADGEPAPSEGLPDLTLACLGGGTSVELARLTGDPLVLNFWASWCGPCREEMPLFARLHRELGSDLRILGVDMDDAAPGAALDLAAASGVTFPLVADPDSTTRVPLQVLGLPQTVFVDAEGKVVATERVAYTSYDDLAAAVRKHLGVEP